MATLLVGVSTATLKTRSSTAALVPDPSEFVNAVWTAAFVVILSTAALKFFNNSVTSEQLLHRAKSDIGEELWGEVPLIAQPYDCDPTFVRAVIAGEALQRPRWLRNLEGIKGKLHPSGTYGVAQVRADRPISDRESISRLCEMFASFYPEAQQLDSERLMAKIELHNPDRRFSRLVYDFYSLIKIRPTAKSKNIARDGRPKVEILAARREGQSIRLIGTIVAQEGTVVVTAESPGATSLSQTVQADAAAPSRGDWNVLLPIESTKVAVINGGVLEPESRLNEMDEVAILELNYLSPTP